MLDWVNNKRWNSINIWVDPVMLLIVAALCIFGLVMVTSASMELAGRQYDNPWHFIQRQGVYLLSASLISLFVYTCACDLWLKYSFQLLLLSVFLLALVLLIGTEINGSQRWLSLGGFSVQPSEAAKLACIVFIANYIARHRYELRETMSGLIKPIIMIFIVVVLLLFEPDYGTAAILFAIVSAMLFLAGVKLRWFFVYLLLNGSMFWWLAVYTPYRWERIKGFLDPWQDPYGSGYQLTQSLIAIGSGSWFGRGLGDSVQKQFYLPEAHTDFIFSVIAEEFGFIAVLLLLLGYLTIVRRCFTIARRAEQQKQTANAYLVYGTGIWLGIQAFSNIAVAMGVLPTKGIPLPLISVGGSSLLVTLVAIAIVQRVHYEACCADMLLMRRYKQSLANV